VSKLTFPKRNPNAPRMKVQSKRDDKILSNRDYLADYFATLEGFKYKPSVGSLEQLSEAQQLLGWDGKQYYEAHKQLEDALVQQFNHNFGSSSNDVAGWMAVCKAAGTRPVPSDIGGCRRVGHPRLSKRDPDNAELLNRYFRA
jgi:hypothetical protein